MDVTDLLLLVGLIGLECLFDAFVVAYMAGKKSKKALVGYLTSEESDELWDRQTQKVMDAMEPRLAEFEARLDEPIKIDFAPVVAEVSGNVSTEVDKIRAVIDGKLGWVRKVGKQTGEAVAEEAAGLALKEAGIDTGVASLLGELDALLGDRAWVKEHPAAAVGLRLIKARGGDGLTGALTPGGASGGGAFSPGLRKR